MTRYNTQFELSLDDMDMIETALRETKTRLSSKSLGEEPPATGEIERVRQIHELLGRLHNQKQFYRPRSGAYISG